MFFRERKHRKKHGALRRTNSGFAAGPQEPPQIQNAIFSKLHVFQGVQESEVSVKSKRKLLLASALGIGDKVWYPVR
jgi:hypothetical protein